MGEPLEEPPPGFDDMSVEEQIDFVQMLWTRIARKSDEVPIPDWHIRGLEERLAAMAKDGGRGRPWEEVRQELRDRLAKRRR